MASQPFDHLARRLRRRLRRVPALQPLVNRAGLWLWRRDLRRRAAQGEASEHAAQPIRLDPRSIETQVPASDLPLAGALLRDAVGRVAGGSWDAHPRPLAEHPVVEGIRQRFEEGRAWEATALHRAAVAGLEAGRPLWKFRSPADVPRLLAKIDDLHRAMGTEGYRTQGELGTHRLWDEVLVAVDRRGRVHLVDGAHRLALAQVLRLPEIPVLVAVRHAEWDEFRRSMIRYARDRGEGVYQRLDHPDLAVVPYVHGSGRWPLIEPHLPPGGGTALDIGANAGLFSFALARRGFRVTAVERSEKEAYVLGRLVGASSLPIRVVKASIFEAPLEKRYRVVLALNIFHHFLKTEPTLRLLEGLLGGLTADLVFFESHDPDEAQMRGAFFNPAPRDFAEWVAGRLGLGSVRLIGTPEGRSLFLLERGEVPAA